MFYKKNEDGTLQEADHIEGENFLLDPATRHEYSYPVHGWYWFDTEAEAISALGTVPL